MALSPGAEEHDAAEIGAGQARPERALVAAGVGVVADGAGVVSEHDSVDRAEPQRRRIHVVEQVHHRALAQPRRAADQQAVAEAASLQRRDRVVVRTLLPGGERRAHARSLSVSVRR